MVKGQRYGGGYRGGGTGEGYGGVTGRVREGYGGEVHGGYGGGQNSSPAGYTSLIWPLLYGQSPKISVPAASMASNSLTYIGKAPKTQFCRQNWPQIASLI